MSYLDVIGVTIGRRRVPGDHPHAVLLLSEYHVCWNGNGRDTFVKEMGAFNFESLFVFVVL